MNNKRIETVKKKNSEVASYLFNVLVFWCYAILFLQGMFRPEARVHVCECLRCRVLHLSFALCLRKFL